MACFSSAYKAVVAAIDMQKGFDEYRLQENSFPIQIKIGINSGEPVTEGGDFFGTAVQFAARLCDLSEPGQILTSQVVRDLCLGKLLNFSDVGKMTFKGFSEPLSICEVLWE